MTINVYAIPGLKNNDEIAADIWDIPVKFLYMHTRIREVVECRHVLLWYYKSTTKLSPLEIGKLYNVDRVTVYHACKLINTLIEVDPEFKLKHDLFMKNVRKNSPSKVKT